MTDETGTDVLEKDVVTTTDTDTQSDADAGTDKTTDTTATDDTTADTGQDNTVAGDDKDTTSDKGDDTTKADWPDDWRERMAGDDEDAMKLIRRYGSPKGVAKALKEAQALIRSGKVKRDMPDPSDEKAMAEWRKAEGIPEDPSGYVLPETVTKRVTDEDKPLLANFTEYAHKKGAPQVAVDIASEWYFDTLEQMEAERTTKDTEAADAAEEALRKDWGREYKSNITLANRFMETVPGGNDWHLARLPDGRTLGSIPEFVAWASDQGRDRFGDVTFATPDAERKHTARKTEIEALMKEDISKYYETGADREYAEILQREMKRQKG